MYLKPIFLSLILLGTAAAGQRPNILFLFADDWGWPHASCLGDPVVKTPTFDPMAREGLLFRNAHSASPSRAAILTGTQTHTAYSGIDAGPTKGWMILNRDQPTVRKPFQLAFGKRPERELYDLAKDPHELVNVADDPAYTTQLKQLEQRLMTELTSAGDPRATGEDPNRFEKFKSAERGKDEKE